MQLVLLLAADYANVAQGGKVNVMGIFRAVFAQRFPVVHTSMVLVIKLAPGLGEKKSRRLTVKFLDHDGTELGKIEGTLEIPQHKGNLPPEINALFELRGLQFPHPGMYQFSVYVDDDLKGTLPIEAVQGPPPE